MSVTVRIPRLLAKSMGGRAEVEALACTEGEPIESLEASFPGIKARLCEESGELRAMLNVYVNNTDIRFLDGVQTRLQEGDYISIVPLIAGG